MSDAVAVTADLLIGGELRPGSAGDRFEVLDPADESVIVEAASATAEDAGDAVSAAAMAQAKWGKAAPRERAEVLRRVFESVTASADALAELISRENGKPLADAAAEVAYAAEFLRWYAEEAVRLNGSVAEAPHGGHKIFVRHEPMGVALLITPWNLPLAMITRKVAPALAAGCGTIVKPASATPISALAFARLAEDAGVPAGLINVLPTRSTAAVVETILGAEPVRKLSFTGSTEVGRKLLAQASSRVISCSMELGGNAPLIVLGDADMDLAVRATLTAKMRHNAEACTAANRLYVQRERHAEFAERLADEMAAMRVGRGLEPATDVGPLIDGAAREQVHNLVGAATAGGAEVLTGASLPEGRGFFYPPTVLTSVAPTNPILRDEIFGPVAPIVGFDDEDELLAWANDSEFGLMSYVFSRDLGRAMAVADRLETGMVAINRGVISDPAAPFGGIKQSGIGREGGHDGMLEYTESKYIGVEW